MRRKKKKKKKKRRNSRRGSRPVEGDTSDSSSSSDPSPDYLRWKKSSAYLEREKAKLVDAWIKEAKEKELKNRWDKRFHRYLFKQYTYVEATFANLPPTIGAIALSIANLGVDWFKFTEENLDSCQPVHFHSDQCTFPEVRVRIRHDFLSPCLPYIFFSFPAVSTAIPAFECSKSPSIFTLYALALLACLLSALLPRSFSPHRLFLMN